MDPSDSVVLYMVPGAVLGLVAGAISLEITFESNLTTPIITNVVIGVCYIFLSLGMGYTRDLTICAYLSSTGSLH